jgi:hypothetical protein
MRRISIIAALFGVLVDFVILNSNCLALEPVRPVRRTVTPALSAVSEVLNQGLFDKSSIMEKSCKERNKGNVMVDALIAQSHSDASAPKPKSDRVQGLNLVDLAQGEAIPKTESGIKLHSQTEQHGADARKGAKIAATKDKIEPPIGEAWLESDGSLTMHLMRDADGHPLDATLSYGKKDKDYNSTIQHIGGLKPGEHKLVPPVDDTSGKK